jgi:hypothetical protein
LDALREYLNENDICSIAIPAPGCGNGRLDWVMVKKLLEDKLADLPIDIRVYEPL